MIVGARTAKHNLTCVFCRAKWVLAGAGGAAGGSGGGAAAGGGRRTAEGYLNFGAEAGLSPVRDTSTCMSGFLSSLILALCSFALDARTDDSPGCRLSWTTVRAETLWLSGVRGRRLLWLRGRGEEVNVHLKSTK